MHRRFYTVYILTNISRSVLYIGVTNNLRRRLTEHYFKIGGPDSFTKRYNVIYLLYYEEFHYVNDAIRREKEIKKWNRQKKLELIAKRNPKLLFLNEELFPDWPPANSLNKRV